MKHSSSEADGRSAGQNISRLLWNPNVHYRVHNSPQPVPVLSQMNSVYTLLSYFLGTHFNIILHLRLGLPSGLSFWLSNQNFEKFYLLTKCFSSQTRKFCEFLFCPMRATCLAHVFLDNESAN
jgi:hypothetical protein